MKNRYGFAGKSALIILTMFITPVAFSSEKQSSPVIHNDDPYFFNRQFIESFHIQDRYLKNPLNITTTNWTTGDENR